MLFHFSLSWRKYDLDLKSQHCLLKMSRLSWPQQRLFKEAYDRFKVSSTTNATNTATKELIKRNVIVQGLNLKQLGKSIKYMTINEREHLKEEKAKQIKAKERAADKKAKTPQESGINGEWEKDHDFMCCSCNIVFDEHREILHHKWEAHPYCLVAHVTIRRDLR